MHDAELADFLALAAEGSEAYVVVPAAAPAGAPVEAALAGEEQDVELLDFLAVAEPAPPGPGFARRFDDLMQHARSQLFPKVYISCVCTQVKTTTRNSKLREEALAGPDLL